MYVQHHPAIGECASDDRPGTLETEYAVDWEAWQAAVLAWRCGCQKTCNAGLELLDALASMR